MSFLIAIATGLSLPLVTVSSTVKYASQSRPLFAGEFQVFCDPEPTTYLFYSDHHSALLGLTKHFKKANLTTNSNSPIPVSER